MKNITVSIEAIGNRLVTLGRCVNITGQSGNKFAHEFHGMLNLLMTVGVDYDIDWNQEVTKMTATTIGGERFEF